MALIPDSERLTQNPDLIDGARIDDDNPRRWLLIKREVLISVYPDDAMRLPTLMQEKVTQTDLEQAEVLCTECAVERHLSCLWS